MHSSFVLFCVWFSNDVIILSDKVDKPLVGVVEMGGASVQIAFEPDGDDVTEHLFPVHVSDRCYLLYAHSYLGLGESSVVDHVKSLLESAEPQSTVVHNPCMLRGTPTTTHKYQLSLIDPRDEIVL